MIRLTDNLEKLANVHNFPNDYVSLLSRGFNFIDCSTDEINITHKEDLDILEKNQFFLLINKYNLSDLKDEEYRFTDIVGFFNALDKSQYECIRNRDFKSMNEYYIMRFALPYQPNVTKYLRRIRRFIHR